MTDARQDSQAELAGDEGAAWRDPRLPVADRVTDLLSRMTLDEKAGQLAGFWPAPSAAGQPVAPMQDQCGAETSLPQAAAGGLGHLTRVFGTAPVSPHEGAEQLRELQGQVTANNRFGIPAIVHEECLTGLMTFGATVFPCPLAWGASFDEQLVVQMSTAVGTTMRALGIHQGLAPVLDVTRDYRWGRTEETIGEDPYLVATLGSAYVRGLESAGVVATLKHFAGYSTSRAGRNLAPAAIGPREFADVIVEPFAVALRHGGPRSVMHSYADVDGVPSAADDRLLTSLLREELGFPGVVVADYFGISFLETLHGVAGSPGEAASLALGAGVDIELPTVRCYGEPLLDLVRRGDVPAELVDRAARRVLTQKCELGLLDPAWASASGDGAVQGEGSSPSAAIDIDPPEQRQLARHLAEESAVLLTNDGVLPLDPATPREVAVVGPHADDPAGMLGCYTFPVHVGRRYPDLPLGLDIPTLAQALRAELPDVTVHAEPGCGIDDTGDEDGSASGRTGSDGDFAAAVEAARRAGVCVLALGDRSGMFGRGTSGEGCDAETLALPGRQAALASAVLATGTPTVIVVLSGRPYALDGLADRAAATIQAFFPGEEGAPALAGIISGRVEPSGRLPVSVPRHLGGQPGTYLHATLAGRSEVSSVDPTPLYAFGHGLTWTHFAYTGFELTIPGGRDDIPTDGAIRVCATVRNSGERAGTEVTQLYLSDPVASVVRPEQWLAGWAKFRLEPGQSARVEFTVHADRTSFTGRDLRRIVEPGRIDVSVGSSSADLPLRGSFLLSGPERTLGQGRVMDVPATVTLL